MNGRRFLKQTGCILLLALATLHLPAKAADGAISGMVERYGCGKVKSWAQNKPAELFRAWAEDRIRDGGSGFLDGIAKRGNVLEHLSAIGDYESLINTYVALAYAQDAEDYKKVSEMGGKFLALKRLASLGAVPVAVWTVAEELNAIAVALNNEIIQLNINTFSRIAERHPEMLGPNGVDYFLNEIIRIDDMRPYGGSYEVVKRRAALQEYAVNVLGYKNYPPFRELRLHNEIRTAAAALLKEVREQAEKRRRAKALRAELAAHVAELQKELAVLKAFSGSMSMLKGITCTDNFDDAVSNCTDAAAAVDQDIIDRATEVANLEPPKLHNLRVKVSSIESDMARAERALAESSTPLAQYCETARGRQEQMRTYYKNALAKGPAAEQIMDTARQSVSAVCEIDNTGEAKQALEESRNTIQQAKVLADEIAESRISLQQEAPPPVIAIGDYRSAAAEAAEALKNEQEQLDAAIATRDAILTAIAKGEVGARGLHSSCPDIKQSEIDGKLDRFGDIRSRIPELEPYGEIIAALQSRIRTADSYLEQLETQQQEQRICLADLSDLDAYRENVERLESSMREELARLAAEESRATQCLAAREKNEPANPDQGPVLEKIQALTAIAEKTAVLADDINGLCESTGRYLKTAEAGLSEWREKLAARDAEGTAADRTGSAVAAAYKTAGALAQEADAAAKRLAESVQQINRAGISVCELESRAAAGSGATAMQEMQYRQATASRQLDAMRLDFNRLRSIRSEAEKIKAELGNSTDVSPERQSGEELAPLAESVRTAYREAETATERARNKYEELKSARVEAALLVKQARQVLSDIENPSADHMQELDRQFTKITAARDRSGACLSNGDRQLAALRDPVNQLDSEMPAGDAAGGGTNRDRILAQAEIAIDNAEKAERLINIEELNGRIQDGASCLARAEAARDQRSQGELLAALNDCDLVRAEREIAGGDVDPELIRRYEALRQKESAVEVEIQRAVFLSDNCQFTRAEEVLTEASRTGVCKKTMDKLMNSLLIVKSAARKAAAAERAFNEADDYYRRGDYKNSYSRLQQAKQDAACSMQITRINNGLGQVEEKLQTASTNPPPGTAGDAQPATGGTAANPVCQQYQEQLTALGIRQQRLATQVHRISSEERAKALHQRIMENSRQLVALVEESRAAGCHDSTIPPEVRTALGMPADNTSPAPSCKKVCIKPWESPYGSGCSEWKQVCE